jgi:uncharacterized damage-inducible protein DinB
MEVIDLVCYNHVVRGLYFETMTKLPWKEIVKSRGASYDSMRDVFLHLTLVEDRWINYIIPDRFKDWKDLNFDDFKNFAQLKDYMVRVHDSTESYLRKLKPGELNRQIVVPWGDKPDTRVSIETALSHMVIEDLIHYGELSALLWQMGMEAPYLGFWRYKHSTD